MEPDTLQTVTAGPAKRGRMEIRTMIFIVLAVMILGGIWVAVNGSPTRNRAAIDSNANPTSTFAPRTAPAPH
jgi:hypothetical protein